MTALAPEHPGGAWIIHKYDLAPGVTRIDTPGTQYLLHADWQDGADWQHGGPKVWVQRPANDDDDTEKLPLDILVIGTGHRVDLDGWRYLSTMLAHGGVLVLHVYWRLAPIAVD